MSETFEPVFAELRRRMLGAAPGMTVTKDTPGNLELRTTSVDAKGAPGWYGTVTTKKSYVAVHLMALYDAPNLADGISDELAKRKQGKTCFNFKRADADLFDELETLMRSCAAASNTG